MRGVQYYPVTWQKITFRRMPQPELLETFPNPYPGRNYEIFMTTPEFTSLCPIGGIETDAAELALLKGGAPDFAIPFTAGLINPFSVGFVTLWAAAALTLVTGWDYLRVGLKHMD